tara:strand:+ start:940 stop:2373 length:1434 start_codon:yes stop_codon:yes gene_type:complete
MIINHLMKDSDVSFGTSGVRGLAKNMTFSVCHAYVTAFIQYLEEIDDLNSKTKTICIAGDLRPSTKEIMLSVCCAIMDKKYKVINCGNIPTPALAHYSFQNNFPSIMITGSHVPSERNGIKFYKRSGEILKKDEVKISLQDVKIREVHGINSLPEILTDAEELYCKRYTSVFTNTCLKDQKIGIYQHSAVGRDILVKVLQDLGADIVVLGRSEEFIPVDTESIREEDIKLAVKWCSEFNLDAIVSTDGDSDRPLICDENGNWLRGDIIGIMVSDYLNADSVSTPITSNTILEKINKFEHISRTKIGSPFVIESMINSLGKHSKIVGYEANGGYLTNSDFIINNQKLTSLPTRDALLPIIIINALAKKSNKSISHLINKLPLRFTFSDRLENYPFDKYKELFIKYKKSENINNDFGNIFGKVNSIDITDGLRIFFDSSKILHIRPSGNAPELRVYIETSLSNEGLYLLKNSLEIILKN